MEHPFGHHLVSLLFAGVALGVGLLIIVKRLQRRWEFRFCLVLLALYALWQISELFGGVMEHVFSDIFKLAPMLLLVVFGLAQRTTDQQQTEAIECLKKEVERLERDVALKKTMNTT